MNESWTFRWKRRKGVYFDFSQKGISPNGQLAEWGLPWFHLVCFTAWHYIPLISFVHTFVCLYERYAKEKNYVCTCMHTHTLSHTCTHTQNKGNMERHCTLCHLYVNSTRKYNSVLILLVQAASMHHVISDFFNLQGLLKKFYIWFNF